MFPQLGRIERKYRETVAVVGVHSGKFTAEQDTRLIQSALARFGLHHPVVNDADYSIWQSYAARSWPSLFFLDPRGYVIGKIEGERSFAELDQIVGEMLAQFEAEGLLDHRPIPELPAAAAGGPLAFPGAVAVDGLRGRLAISDTGHHRLLLTDLDGKVDAVIGTGTAGLQDGPIAAAQFHQPQGLALDGDLLYVADSHNHAIRRVDLGRGLVETIAGTGEMAAQTRSPGPARQTALRSPWDVALLGQHLAIAMAGSHQIWVLDLAQAEVGVLAGSGAERIDDGPFAQATFAQPFALAAHAGMLCVADSESSAVRALDLKARQVRTLVGKGLFDWGDADGPFATARLQHPGGLVWAEGALWVADTYNHKLKRLDLLAGQVQTLGLHTADGESHGARSAPILHEPGGLAAHDGWLYVADTGNHAVRKVHLATGDTLPLAVG